MPIDDEIEKMTLNSRKSRPIFSSVAHRSFGHCDENLDG